MLWDRGFDLAPEPSRNFALALWKEHVVDHETGAFVSSAGFGKKTAPDNRDFPRFAGFFIRTWSVAYARTQDRQFLQFIEALLDHLEKRCHPTTGLIASRRGVPVAWSASSLSLAVDCDGAAHRVPDPPASRLRAFASRQDDAFCGLPHDFKSPTGFILERKTDGTPADREGRSSWSDPHSQMGLLCVSRYENTGRPAYRDLLIAAAEVEMKSPETETARTLPLTFGHAISLQVAAWRHTARPAHLDEARRLADEAVAKFFDGSPLPRASTKSEHYESITGADTLALALVELHLNILAITAVRAPPNTIDR
jgi:hypothetical protein